MKIKEPVKPRKPSEPYKPPVPQKPDEFEFIPNKFDLHTSMNLLEICQKLNIDFTTLNPEDLFIDHYDDYGGGYTTIYHATNIKVKKSDHTFKWEIANYEKDVKNYNSKLKKYEKKMEKYNEEMKVYDEQMKVYKEEVKAYNQKMKELQAQEKLEMFNKLKKELGL